VAVRALDVADAHQRRHAHQKAYKSNEQYRVSSTFLLNVLF
jgi:hypothetical protein